jgi:hypothetical protein
MLFAGENSCLENGTEEQESMAVKTKMRTKAKKGKKPARKATTKKAKKAKKAVANKTGKSAVAKKSPVKKAVKRSTQSRRQSANKSTKKAAKRRTSKMPAAKTAWRISPEISQSVLQIDTWKRGDLRIEHLKVYRTGWIIVDQLPDLSGYNPDEGIDIFEEFEFDQHQLHDGTKQASAFPDELTEEERARLHNLSEAELEQEGWILESVIRFKGPLVVEQV